MDNTTINSSIKNFESQRRWYWLTLSGCPPSAKVSAPSSLSCTAADPLAAAAAAATAADDDGTESANKTIAGADGPDSDSDSESERSEREEDDPDSELGPGPA